MRIFHKTNFMLRALALMFAGQWLVFQWMLRNPDSLTFPEYFWLGNDFSYLYSGAGLFLSGHSPYHELNFVPLPPALYLPMLLHRLSYWNAFTAFRTVSFLLVIVAIFWLCRQLRLNTLNSALMLLIAMTYGPFYSVLAGGNLDALMLAFLVFSCARSAPVRGAFLGLSIGTKFYSLLLIPVLALRRRWREILWAIGVLALLLLPFFHYLPDAFSSVFHRTSALRLDGNESPAVLFILLFGEKRVWAWRSCYALLWAGTLLLRLAADARSETDPETERFKALEYLPWMAGAPVLAFTYTGTILLPVILYLARRNQDRRLRRGEWISVGGFLLTAVYSPVCHRILITLLPTIHVDRVMMAVAPLGISAMLVGGGMEAWNALSSRSEVIECRVVTAQVTG